MSEIKKENGGEKISAPEIEKLNLKFKNSLGKNLLQVITGGGSISEEVLSWMKIFGVPVTNSYGCTGK